VVARIDPQRLDELSYFLRVGYVHWYVFGRECNSMQHAAPPLRCRWKAGRQQVSSPDYHSRADREGLQVSDVFNAA